MPPATASARRLTPRRGRWPPDAAYLARRRARQSRLRAAARSFLRRWPDPQVWAAQPLPVRLRANSSTRPFLTFLMLAGRPAAGLRLPAGAQAGRYLAGGLTGSPLARIWTDSCPRQPNSGSANGSRGDRLPGRVRQAADPDRPLARRAHRRRSRRVRRGVPGPAGADRRGWQALPRRDARRPAGAVPPRRARHRRGPAVAAGALRAADGRGRRAAARRTGGLPGTQAAHLQPKTVSSLATRLAGTSAGSSPTSTRPGLAGRAGPATPHRAVPGRRWSTRHQQRTGEPITVADRPDGCDRWPASSPTSPSGAGPTAPGRERLFFRARHPRLPRPLPRYLPADADRRLSAALHASPNRLARRRAAAATRLPGCASASCSTWNWTACTRSPAPGPG